MVSIGHVQLLFLPCNYHHIDKQSYVQPQSNSLYINGNLSPENVPLLNYGFWSSPRQGAWIWIEQSRIDMKLNLIEIKTMVTLYSNVSLVKNFS